MTICHITFMVSKITKGYLQTSLFGVV